jgi:hypothetical protein
LAQPLKRLGLILALSLSLWAQPVRVEFTQEHLSVEEEASLQRGLQWMVDYFQAQGMTPTRQIKARIFPDFDSFRGYQMSHRSFAAGDSPTRTAYYSIGMKELVTWRTPGLLPLLVHESQHALLRSFYRRPPKWLNEGLSEVFEGLDCSSEPPSLKPQRGRLRKVKRLIKLPEFTQQVLGVVGLSERDYNQRANLKDFDSYTCSWALIFFLWSQAEGPNTVGELIRSQQRGEPAEETLGRLAPSLADDLLPFYEALL